MQTYGRCRLSYPYIIKPQISTWSSRHRNVSADSVENKITSVQEIEIIDWKDPENPSNTENWRHVNGALSIYRYEFHIWYRDEPYNGHVRCDTAILDEVYIRLIKNLPDQIIGEGTSA